MFFVKSLSILTIFALAGVSAKAVAETDAAAAVAVADPSQPEPMALPVAEVNAGE
jgi:hypothetical protein